MTTLDKTDRAWKYHYGFTDGMKAAYKYDLVRKDLSGNPDYEEGFLDGADTALRVRGFKTLTKSRESEILSHQKEERPDNAKPKPLKPVIRQDSDDSMYGIEIDSMFARIFTWFSKLF